MQTFIKYLNLGFLLPGVAISVFLGGCTEDPLQPQGNPEEFKLAISEFSATYVDSSKSVILRWNRPAGQVSFYRIYRTTRTDESGEVDTNSFVSSELRESVDSTRTEFSDVLSLVNGSYFYMIRAVRVLGNGADTVFGMASPVSECNVGVTAGFSINRGVAQTAIDRCTLIVTTTAGYLDSIRFTQKAITYLVRKDAQGNIASKTQVSFQDPANPPSNEEISRLVYENWISGSSGKLASGVEVHEVPNFEANDDLNPVRAHRLPNDRDSMLYVWNLSKGNGVKRVYAERIALGPNGEVVHKDVINDDIAIASHRFKVRLKNDLLATDAKVKRLPNTNKFFLADNTIKFSIAIFADSTISEEFEYWIAVSDSMKIIDKGIPALKDGWLETIPKKGRLTGRGSSHNDEQIYEYSLDPSSPEGAAALNSLRLTFKAPQSDLAFPLSGKTFPNAYSAPGSYWGEDPRYWDTSVKGIRKAQRTITGTPADNYRRIINLKREQAFSYGVKQFAIVARFKGRYFDDVRTVCTIEGSDSTYFDVYPPAMYPLDKDDPLYINNGKVITGPFDLLLSRIQDGQGETEVAEAKLIIARKPESMQWDYWTWKESGPPLMLSSLLELPHRTLTYVRNDPSFIWSGGIDFSGIDPREWQSGEYIMGVVTKDKYGNQGFAPMSTEHSATNPWIVSIISGK